MGAAELATGPFDTYLAERLPSAASGVAPPYREVTVCYAYMCGYAYGCGQKTDRPAQVMKGRCMRYLPEALRVSPGLSDLAIDLLARHRQRGRPLSSATLALLDELRPNGPLRRQS